jgi:hypothetical protein
VFGDQFPYRVECLHREPFLNDSKAGELPREREALQHHGIHLDAWLMSGHRNHLRNRCSPARVNSGGSMIGTSWVM